jgi:hypothetical protein
MACTARQQAATTAPAPAEARRQERGGLAGAGGGRGDGLFGCCHAEPIRVIDRGDQLAVFGALELFPPDRYARMPDEWSLEVSHMANIM